MAHADASEEWLRLTRLYQEMCETELLRLREDFHDLTPIAQDVLRPILETRGLWNSVPIVEDSSAQSRHADYSFLRTSADLLGPEPVDRDSTLMDTGVAVLACDSLEDAGLLRTVLEEKSIPSVVITTKRGYPVRFPEILVFQEDVARATELLDGRTFRACVSLQRTKAVR